MKKHIATAIVIIAACAAWMPTHAFAAADIAYVSSSGDEVNALSDCSREKPCRSLMTAASVANPGGRVVVLDSGQYGALAINKSLTITAPPGIYAEVSGVSQNGVSSIAIGGESVKVALKGLTITSSSASGSGISMSVSSGPSYLSIEDSTIAGFVGGEGLSVEGFVHAQITGTEFRGNFIGASIRRGAQATITRSRFFSNRKYAVEAKVASSPVPLSATTVVIKDSIVQGTLYFQDSAAFRADRYPNMPPAIIRFSDCIVTGNNNVRSPLGAGVQVESYGNNAIEFNGAEHFFNVKLQ